MQLANQQGPSALNLPKTAVAVPVGLYENESSCCFILTFLAGGFS
jgi:hypothetical protein